MARLPRFVPAFVALFAVFACTKKPQADLHVLSFSPTAHVSAEQPLRLQFSAPAVPASAVGKPLTDLPVALTPAPEGPAGKMTARWADPQTLLVETAGLHAATQYKLALRGALADRTVEHEFAFVEAPLSLLRVTGVDLRGAPSRGFDLYLTFNQPVRSQAAAANCVLQGGDTPVALQAVVPTAIATEVALRAPSLPPGAQFQFHCDHVPPATGDAPLDAPFETTLTVAPAFKVVSVTPSKDARIEPDEARLRIQFSTQVDIEAVAKSVHLNPPVKTLANAWTWADDEAREAVLDLEPSTKYTLTVDKDLHDEYGQALALDVSPTYAFQTGNGKPRMRMDRGVVTVEADRRPLLWTRNISSVHVKCAMLAADKAAVFMAQHANVIQRSWSDESQEALDWSGLAVQEFDLPIVSTTDKWHKDELDLPAKCGTASRGLVVAEVTSSELKALKARPWNEPWQQRLLANVTDIGLVVKTGTESGLVWAVGLHDGKPIADATAQVFAPSGLATAHGTTNQLGLWRLPGNETLLGPKAKGADNPALENEGGHTLSATDLLVVVQKGDDLAVTLGDWRQGMYPWSFGVPYSWNGAAATIRGVLFTDRGVYRPGETAHFKGVVRDVSGKGMTVPREKVAHVKVQDARGAVMLQKDLELTPFGGFSFDLDVAETAALGDWEVAADVGGATLQQSFLVAEFRRQTFEVKVAGPAPQPGSRQALPFQVDARYLFGAPVAHAKVSWTAAVRRHDLSFSGYEDWNFQASEYGYSDDYSGGDAVEPGAEGTGTADDAGHFAFNVQPGKEDGSGPVDYVISAEVVDAANDTVTGHTVTVLYPSEFYVGLNSPWLAEAKKAVTLQAVALHPDGTPARTSATLKLVREDWVCTPRRHSSAYDEDCKHVETASTEQQVTLNGAQTALTVTPPEPGSYHVELSAKDAKGHVVKTSSWLWVHGAGNAAWQPSGAAKMDLVASQKTYKPGDSARILARTSLHTGLALLTVERNGVLDARVQPLKGQAEPFDFRLSAENAPNVMASVTVVQGRSGPEDKQRPRLQMGVVNLPVVASDRHLKVTVTTARESYEPGEEVTATVKLSANDAPVVGEVAVSVADEGVLQLIGFRTPDLHDPMYAPWDWAVTTATNWTNLLRPSDPHVNDTEEGGDSAARSQVRKRFLSSAFWAPALVTDENGTVTVHFTAPDNLTAFRVMAIAADNGARFGSGDKRFTVKKPVQAQPIVPRFLVPGDRADLGVLVHNHSGVAGEALVKVTATGVTVDQAEMRVQVPSEGSIRVPFAATALTGEKATLRIDVSLGKSHDSVEMELPLVERLMVDRTVAGKGRTEQRVEIPVAFQPGFVAGASRLEIAIDRTGMAALQPALKALIAYPYGCLEQTLSRLVPLAKVKELAVVAGLDGLQGPTLDKYLAAGAAKLLKFQDSSGHFSLWPGGHGEPHYTVYAMQGVVELLRSGIAVDHTLAMDGARALADWTRRQTQINGNRDTVTLVQAADVLAGLDAADASLNTRLFDARAALPRFGQAVLLHALVASKAPTAQIQTLLAELLAHVVVEGDAAYVVDRDAGEDDWWWPTLRNVRPTAALLEALLILQPKHPLSPKLAQHLLTSAREDGSWANTHDNAHAVTALAAWARAQSKGEAHVVVQLNGKTLADQTIHGHEAVNLSLPLADVQPGSLSIQTTTPVRYLARVVTARREQPAQAVDRGFQVARRYLNPETGKELTEVKAGQLVKVEIAIQTAKSRRDVALVDPLPAGFEGASLRAEDNDEVLGHGYGADDWTGRWWVWQWKEQRDEETRAFAGQLNAGLTRFHYLARALISGTFTAAPTTVEAMYEPDLHGRSASATVVVK